MATKKQNLSDFNKENVPDATGMSFGIVVSEWNPEITNALYEGAYKTLLSLGAKSKDIIRKNVPGSFELPAAASQFASYTEVDAVICLGCVIQGETKHFDFICSATANSISALNIQYDTPIIFGVLTTGTMQQAQDRAGGKHGNKGDEAAVSAVKMVAVLKEIREGK